VSNLSIEGINILIVDDIDINRTIVQSIFESEGANTVEAKNGTEALEIFIKSEEGYFDMIIMDIQMPLMDGYQATNAIRELDRNDASTVVILAHSAHALADNEEMSRVSGMNGQIAKPLDFEAAIAAAKRYCGKSL